MHNRTSPHNVVQFPQPSETEVLKRDGLRLYRSFMSLTTKDRLAVINLAEKLDRHHRAGKAAQGKIRV